jgi:XRE family transcriptional regulator, regulator of sulfur utilization
VESLLSSLIGVYMDIGKVIKEVRSKKKLKQKELSDYCNISVTYLSQIENNRKDPSLSTLEVISKSLGVPLPMLFFMALEDDDIPSPKKEFFRHIHPSLNSLIREFF